MRKPVVGFEGLYAVDDRGNVFSLVNIGSRRQRKLSPYTNEHGYLKVNLYGADGSCKKKYIHRIVAESFIPNPEGKPIVNHIDANRQNNRVSNLQWCTQSENMKHCVMIGNHVNNLPNAKGGGLICQE